MDKYCIGCVYRACITSGTYCCDYIGIEGHARSLICPPGARCTVRKTERWWTPNPNGRPKVKLDERKCMELYRDGLSDPKIAEHFGCSVKPIVNWRKRNNLKPNYTPRGRKSPGARMAYLNGR